MRPEDYLGAHYDGTNSRGRGIGPKQQVRISSPRGDFQLMMSLEELEALKIRSVEQNSRPEWDPHRRVMKVGGFEISEEVLYMMYSSGGQATNGSYFEAASEKLRRDREAKAAQERAQQDQKRRAQERAERNRAKARQDYNAYEEAYESFRKFGEAWGNAQGVPPRPNTPTPKSDKRKLADLAGVEWEEADNMTLKVLARKAKIKCHPDTGGSHERWLELEEMLNRMKL